MSSWRIERLARSHDRSQFQCGKAPLDEFLRSLVSQYEKRNLGRTYVAVEPRGTRVLGYHTLASGAVTFQNFPDDVARKLPKHPVPVVLLGRLAVDCFVQGQGLGSALLLDALERCLELAGQLGIRAVEVHAIDDEARAFYRKYGFVPLLDSPLHLYLPITVVEGAWPSVNTPGANTRSR